MTTLSTSYERVDALTYISDQVYPILEQQVDGELRARRIVRVGIAGIAFAMRDGETFSQASERFDRHLAYELRSVDFGNYEPYQTPAEKLPDFTIPDDIASLANKYSDTLRGTYLPDCINREPDSVHALHLTALAVPYARAHYSQLDTGKVAGDGLLHDLLEVYTGDKQTYHISPEGIEQKKRGEKLALITFDRDYSQRWPGIVTAVRNYEALADDEAAFIKTMDKNDPGYTHFRNKAFALRHRHNTHSKEAFYERANENTLRTLGYASQFALVLQDKDVLNERIAALFEYPGSAPIIAAQQ